MGRERGEKERGSEINGMYRVEQVEDKLTKACPDIEQIYVHGDSSQSSLVAIGTSSS